MLFKSIVGAQYEIDVPLDVTFLEITRLFNETHLTNYDITYVFAGHTLALDSTPKLEGLTNESTVFIVTNNAPSSISTQETNLKSSEEPAPEQESYIAIYNGEQIRAAMKKSTKVMLSLIHMIGHQNPFFLSYLAVNPTKAMEHIDETLEQPDFKLIIKGDTVSDDPIKPFLMHPSGDNGHQVDERNLTYILEQCSNYPITDESKIRAKETYLLLDRDIRKTINTLCNLDSPLVVTKLTHN